MNEKIYYQIIGMFAEKTGKVLTFEQVQAINKIRLLTKKHNIQCENSCNGRGYIPRKGMFTLGSEDPNGEYKDYKPGFIKDDYSVFDKECKNIELKILNAQCEIIENNSYFTKIKFQNDPRGATVKMFYTGTGLTANIDVTDILYI